MIICDGKAWMLINDSLAMTEQIVDDAKSVFAERQTVL